MSGPSSCSPAGTAPLGYAVFSHSVPDVIAATTAVAARAILAMLVDTMIPKAFDGARNFAGLITVIGLLAASVLSKRAAEAANALVSGE